MLKCIYKMRIDVLGRLEDLCEDIFYYLEVFFYKLNFKSLENFG